MDYDKINQLLSQLKIEHDELLTNLSPARQFNELEREAKNYIAKLHEYNELKDAAIAMIKLIAESRSVKFGDILDEIGVTMDDSNL
ncbi:hypothetical protein DAMA08_029820 [Martiniozyma asiatica (nom. inval.)]|nr:hypothetical protein DAMA08_029820 [Martiniozyma asiatica]